ncbi:hypothetical protein TA3x_004136 [Tundrisphaera sp. TA3]|uniref:hypothetical protein n=1 Tax=Tundrisphaera sp. TA3 TaxID=3435775 RepID=UPI003EB8550C
MTFEQCQANLMTIRNRQGTQCPVVKVAYNGTFYQGRLTRADSDPENRGDSPSPFGLLVLESLGLGRGPETILQIADIPADGIRDMSAA